jgi:hypothetical protein
MISSNPCITQAEFDSLVFQLSSGMKLHQACAYSGVEPSRLQGLIDPHLLEMIESWIHRNAHLVGRDDLPPNKSQAMNQFGNGDTRKMDQVQFDLLLTEFRNGTPIDQACRRAKIKVSELEAEMTAHESIAAVIDDALGVGRELTNPIKP